MANAIEVKNLTKDYGKGRGIFDFSFNVKEGEVFGLVGTNGSGKTTTIRHMMGFLKGDTGSVALRGMDAWKQAAEIKKFVGYVPGQIDFPDVGNGVSFLKIQAELLGLTDFTYMNDLINRLKIDITAPLRRMSKGMKQKMALVAAFMAQPQIYLLDEPSTGLDPLMRDAMVEIILEQKAQGKTVFMSSHVFKELEDTCDSIMFIHDGKIVNTVSREQFALDPHETYTIAFGDAAGYEKYCKAAGDTVINKNQEKREITVNIAVKNINAFLKELSAYGIAGFSHEPYTLEKYYLENIETTEVK
ncbi:MAG: ATP-binding cassette domain-containing protein [Clostridiales bacterium]|nr:ATP-binding cassette domain-containing protein [Clostridiales bacterium]